MQDYPVMFVDDEPNLLDGIRRTLYDRFDIYTATSGKEGLDCIRSDGPFAVVVSDMRMPEMDGAEFLSQVRELAPQTTRILLTGYSDISAAIRAVNNGQLFRFLSKPCDEEALARAIGDGIAQYRLVTSERELLERTLKGAVDVLVEVLGLAAPAVFAESRHVRNFVHHMVTSLQLPEPWRFDLAAQLCGLGCITIPQAILQKAHAGKALVGKELSIWDSQYEVAFKLLSTIPRLEEVAYLIRAQQVNNKEWDERDLPDSALLRGAEILRVALRYQELTRTVPEEEALSRLTSAPEFSAEVLQALTDCVKKGPVPTQLRKVTVRELIPGMVLSADVTTPKGIVVVTQGREVTGALIERLLNFAQGLGIIEPIEVLTKD